MNSIFGFSTISSFGFNRCPFGSKSVLYASACLLDNSMNSNFRTKVNCKGFRSALLRRKDMKDIIHGSGYVPEKDYPTVSYRLLSTV